MPHMSSITCARLCTHSTTLSQAKQWMLIWFSPSSQPARPKLFLISLGLKWFVGQQDCRNTNGHKPGDCTYKVAMLFLARLGSRFFGGRWTAIQNSFWTNTPTALFSRSHRVSPAHSLRGWQKWDEQYGIDRRACHRELPQGCLSLDTTPNPPICSSRDPNNRQITSYNPCGIVWFCAAS